MILELSQANLSPQVKLDEDRARLEGARAKRSGVDFHDNPYRKGPSTPHDWLYSAWEFGFMHAEDFPEPRWRTGRSIGRTLYRDDKDVAYFADREVAAEVVAMLNGEEREGAFAGYRPGLPTAEQVQAQEARGGWWMRMCGSGPPDFVRLFVCAQKSGQIRCQDNSSEGRAYGGGYEFRPCLADGTPVGWPSPGT